MFTQQYTLTNVNILKITSGGKDTFTIEVDGRLIQNAKDLNDLLRCADIKECGSVKPVANSSLKNSRGEVGNNFMLYEGRKISTAEAQVIFPHIKKQTLYNWFNRFKGQDIMPRINAFDANVVKMKKHGNFGFKKDTAAVQENRLTLIGGIADNPHNKEILDGLLGDQESPDQVTGEVVESNNNAMETSK